MNLPTFSQRVAAYLDQYKAANPAGQFISVDPDGDGKKQAIFVSNDGTVNPQSRNPGKWPGFHGTVSNKAKQHKDSPGQLGTHDDPFTGKYTRKPEVQQRLSDKPQPSGETPDWVTDDLPGVKPKADRLPPGFKNAAIRNFLPEDATQAELQELLKHAKDVLKDRAQEIESGADALRQVFGDGRSLTGAQAQARAADDVSQIPGFDEAVAELESSGGWKNDRALLDDIIAYMPGGKIKWAAGSDGKIPAEQIVFEALRMPLPKLPKASDPEVLSEALQKMSGTDKPDARNREERDRDAAYNDLMRQSVEALEAEDWDTYDEVKRRIAEQFPESVDTSVDDFSAMTFRDAVARYAGQLGLFEDEFTGKFNKKPQSQGRLFDSSGGSWKDQPRVEKGNKEGGQWTGEGKAKTPTSSKMDAARKKLLDQKRTTMKSGRKSVKRTIERAGGMERLQKAEIHEMSQNEFLLSIALKVSKERQAALNGRTPAAKYLKKLADSKQGAGAIDWHQAAKEFRDLPGADALAKKFRNRLMGGDGSNFGQLYSGSMRTAFGWLTKKENIELDQNMEMEKLPFFLSTVDFFDTADRVKELLKKHRDGVRKAIKGGKAVDSKAYENYHDADWQPGNKGKSKRSSMKYCKAVDELKERDVFRTNASVGKKLKAAANTQIDGERKKYLALHATREKEIDQKQSELDEHLKSEERNVHQEDATAWNAWRKEYEVKKEELAELRSKSFELLNEWVKGLPSKRLRPEDKTGIQVDYPKGTQLGVKNALGKAVNWLETISGGAMPSMTVALKKTNQNRSFHRSGDIYMNRFQISQKVLCHELGHAIDYHSDQGRKTKAFEAQAIQKHKTKWAGGGCDPDEVGSKNGFMRAYTGKYYNRPKSSEVLSMGIQHLTEHPLRFAKESPDHFNFTIASLRGLLE